MAIEISDDTMADIQPPQVVQVVNQYGYRKWVAR